MIAAPAGADHSKAEVSSVGEPPEGVGARVDEPEEDQVAGALAGDFGVCRVEGMFARFWDGEQVLAQVRHAWRPADGDDKAAL